MALIHLFRRCNQRCVFCSYPAEDGGKEAHGLKSWLKEISGMPRALVQVSGGEPLLADFDELLKLIAFCAKSGRRVEFQSNGIAAAGLTAKQLKTLIKALRAADGYFNINFPSDNAALDYKITQTKGAFAARAKAVKKLLALGAKVRLTHVICSLNYKNTAEFAAFAAGFKELGWVQFSFIKGLGRAEDKRFIPKFSAAAPYLLKALDLCGRKKLKCDVDHIPPCFLAAHWAKNVDIVKLRESRKGPHLMEKKKVPECKGCQFGKFCPGPRIDYIAAHGTMK